MGQMFFWLIVGHALCDFALQSDAMAKGKNRNVKPTNIPPGAIPQTIWPYWLTSHALIHAGAVALITGSIGFGLAEFFAHWLIDYMKCENVTDIHADQAFHLVCKVFWVLSVFTGLGIA